MQSQKRIYLFTMLIYLPTMLFKHMCYIDKYIHHPNNTPSTGSVYVYDSFDHGLPLVRSLSALSSKISTVVSAYSLLDGKVVTVHQEGAVCMCVCIRRHYVDACLCM